MSIIWETFIKSVEYNLCPHFIVVFEKKCKYSTVQFETINTSKLARFKTTVSAEDNSASFFDSKVFRKVEKLLELLKVFVLHRT